MAKSLSSLLGEADELISSRVASHNKTASAPQGHDDIFKLAEWVRKSGEELPIVKEAAFDTALDAEEHILTLAEKLAHAKAYLETYQNLPTLVKIANFEKSAKERGFSEEEIESYLEKNAAEFPLERVL